MNKGPVTGTTIYRPRMPMTDDELEGWTILGEYLREPGNYSRRGMCVEMRILANHQRISYACEAVMQRRLRKYMTDQGKVADTEYLFPVEDLNSRIMVVEKFKRDIALNRTLPAPPTDSTTSPVTPTAVPGAVLTALRAYDRAMSAHYKGHISWQEVDGTRWDVNHAICKAIREATAERDQEIARLQEHNTSLRRDVTALLDQNFGLKAALDGWREAEAGCCPEDMGFVEYISTLQSKIARLTAKLAAARADTARLNWLSQPRDRIAFGINKADNIPGCSLYVGEGCYEPFDAATLREAIDAARADGRRANRMVDKG